MLCAYAHFVERSFIIMTYLYILTWREQWQTSVVLVLQLLSQEPFGEANVLFAGSRAGPQLLAVQLGVVYSQVLQPCWQ